MIQVQMRGRRIRGASHQNRRVERGEAFPDSRHRSRSTLSGQTQDKVGVCPPGMSSQRGTRCPTSRAMARRSTDTDADCPSRSKPQTGQSALTTGHFRRQKSIQRLQDWSKGIRFFLSVNEITNINVALYTRPAHAADRCLRQLPTSRRSIALHYRYHTFSDANGVSHAQTPSTK